MMTVRFAVPLVVLGLILAGEPRTCWARAGDEKKPSQAPVALNGLDPVQLVTGKEAKGRQEFAVERDGFRYLFAATESRVTFEKDPERYAIQFHGRCAMMHRAPAQPDLFAVHKGRIYAFGTEACRTAFLANPEEHAAHRRKVAILIFEGMELLDFAGPAEVFASAGRGEAFEAYTVAATPEPITSQHFVTITPRYTFADCPRPEIIVIPGGNTRSLAQDKRVRAWIEQCVPHTEVVLSVCTGAFVLANAGLLDGKEATTHWSALERLRRDFPKITVRENRRFVDNGKIVTAAGVSAGIDGSLYLVERLLGKETARETARYMEYNWKAEPAK
jgi:putative intracellular protease/amidase/YHS domain-containing protein